MNTDKAIIAGIAVMVIAGLFVSPVQAHRKYRPHHKGLPRRVLVRHSHDLSESTKSVLKMQAETKDFDLFSSTAGIVTGTVKTLGEVVEAIFGSKMKPASETQDAESRKKRVSTSGP